MDTWPHHPAQPAGPTQAPSCERRPRACCAPSPAGRLAGGSMRWHALSLFTAGPRHALSRDERRAWLARADLWRRRGRLTCLAVEIGRALLRRLGADGRLDPAHETIAADAGCSSRTVRRVLRALADLGLLTWQRRLVRAGWRTEQTSNAYALCLADAPPAPPRCGGQAGRGTQIEEKKEAREQAPAWAGSPEEARAALARVRLRLARSPTGGAV
jgi:AraC-like DNA-binding protein